MLALMFGPSLVPRSHLACSTGAQQEAPSPTLAAQPSWNSLQSLECRTVDGNLMEGLKLVDYIK